MKERWQAARQHGDVLPRIHRGWTYAGLRAATNVLQRDLNTAVIAEEMRKGTRSIYVDYVDYDEIAHHAGMFRPSPSRPSTGWIVSSERSSGSRSTLPGATTSWCSLTASPRAKRSRTASAPDLGEVCTQLMQEEVASLDAPVEEWGRVESLAEDLAGSGVTGRAANRAAAAKQATHRPKRRSRDHRRNFSARLRKSRHAVCALPRPTLSGGSAGTLAQARSRLCAHKASDSSPAWTPQVCRGPSVRTAASGSTPAR